MPEELPPSAATRDPTPTSLATRGLGPAASSTSTPAATRHLDPGGVRQRFHALSLSVWLVWLVPYVTGMLSSMAPSAA